MSEDEKMKYINDVFAWAKGYVDKLRSNPKFNHVFENMHEAEGKVYDCDGKEI